MGAGNISAEISPGSPTHTGVPRQHARSVALFVCSVLLFAGCSGGGTEGTSSDPKSDQATTTTTLAPPTVTSTVANGATDVPITNAVGLKVAGGTFRSVQVARAPGAAAGPAPGEGMLDAAKTGWLSAIDFAPHTPYRVNATIIGANGKTSQQSWTFTTGAPTAELHTSTNVADSAVYGVGMPIIVTLNTPAPAVLRKTVTDHLKVTSEPAVIGGWRWVSDTELRYRPAQYWPAHTQVHLNVDFANLNLGNGVWGVDGRTINFSIGDSHISTVDSAAHTMSVQVNGQVVNTFPISTGRPGPTTETRSGIHVVNEKAPLVVMDSSTIGIPVNSPGGYKIDAEWSVRISNSGEFVHSAPWSVGSQGYANVSHGCVNASPSNAKWFFDLTMTGDVVQVINTPRQLEPWNGYGDWQIPWDQWVN